VACYADTVSGARVLRAPTSYKTLSSCAPLSSCIGRFADVSAQALGFLVGRLIVAERFTRGASAPAVFVFHRVYRAALRALKTLDSLYRSGK
jgi:hypothetical protein